MIMDEAAAETKADEDPNSDNIPDRKLAKTAKSKKTPKPANEGAVPAAKNPFGMDGASDGQPGSSSSRPT
ncbi:hypothetical protein PspLS_08022 [Pyricularia sp. CBS 133598]|nr:hypothetical protein PspLS_08022 [Pyricularia sp. CBS 133598]